MPTIARGNHETPFSDDEWLCIRYCQANYGRVGPSAVLLTGGDMAHEGVVHSLAMLDEVRRDVLDARVTDWMKYGRGSASSEFFELITGAWKQPYLRCHGTRGRHEHKALAKPEVVLGNKKLGSITLLSTANTPVATKALHWSPSLQDVDNPALLARVPLFRELPVFMGALKKLEDILSANSSQPVFIMDLTQWESF